jgi:hypothetical protein
MGEDAMQKLVLYLIGRVIPVLSLAVVAAGTSSNLMYTGGYSGPFAPYGSIMPGQPVTAAGNQLCEPQTVPGYIDAISCEVYIGDIVRRWGRPDVMTKDNQAFYIFWYDQGLYGIVDPFGAIGRFGYMLPVESLTIGLQPHNPLR